MNMTRLRCDVKNCLHNENHLCDRHDIMVNGEYANAPAETNCSSFCNSSCSASNKSGYVATEETNIACNATTCVYNILEKCNAKHIQMIGIGASQPEGTLCSTFQRK